jgi:hypothetical protein
MKVIQSAECIVVAVPAFQCLLSFWTVFTKLKSQLNKAEAEHLLSSTFYSVLTKILCLHTTIRQNKSRAVQKLSVLLQA